jgi:hypothetical protein
MHPVSLGAAYLRQDYRVNNVSLTYTVLIPLPAPAPPPALATPVQSKHPSPLLGSGLGIWPCCPLFAQSRRICWYAASEGQ